RYASSSRSASRGCGSATSSACSTPATCRTGRRATPPSSSPRRSCRISGTSGPSGSTTTAGGSTRWRSACTRRRCSPEAGSGLPLVFFHGAGGLLADNPFLDQLAARYHVFAPELPGYGESTGEELL